MIEQLQKELSTAVLEWLDTHEDANDRFYRGKAVGNAVLTVNEIVAAELIAEKYPDAVVAEIGAGFGQLPLLLSRMGVQAIALEINPTRRAGAFFIRDRFKGDYRIPDLPRRYPFSPSPPFDLVVTANIGSDHWRLWDVPLEEKYRRTLQGKPAVIDVLIWWELRVEPERQEYLVWEIEQQGYTSRHVHSTVWEFTPC